MQKEISAKEALSAYLNGDTTVRIHYSYKMDAFPLNQIKRLVESGATFTIEADQDFEVSEEELPIIGG